jgi:hypothetical protein
VPCLVIRKRSNAHMGDVFRACDTGCREQGAANASYRVGIYYVTAAGRPFGHLLPGLCCKQLVRRCGCRPAGRSRCGSVSGS